MKNLTSLININQILFKQKRLLAEYCEKKGVKREDVFFMYNGKEVFETDTPKSIGYQKGIEFEVFDRINEQK